MRTIVFYAGLLYDEVADHKDILLSQLPDGAYALQGVVWWHMRDGCASTLEEDELPKWVRAYALILV